MSLSEYSVIKRDFNGNRSVPSNFMLDIEYSVITSDVIKSFDCNSLQIWSAERVRLVDYLVKSSLWTRICLWAQCVIKSISSL